MTLKDATHRGGAILSELWAGVSQLTTALVIKVAQITKLSLAQARLIVGAAAVLVVLIFVGLLSVSPRLQPRQKPRLATTSRRP